MTEDNLDLRVRILDAMESRAQLAAVREEVVETGNATVAAGRKASSGFGLFKSGLGGMAAAVGISAAVVGVKDLVKAGLNLQEQQAQLRTALTSIGVTGAAAYKKVDDAAINLSEHGGFSYGNELTSLTNFVHQTKNLTTAEQANAAVTELARGAHVGYAQAQHAVASAMGGNTWGLKQYIGAIIPATGALAALTAQHAREVAALQQQSKLTGAGSVWLKNQEIALNQTFAAQKLVAQQTDANSAAQQILTRVTKAYPGAVGAYNKSLQGVAGNLKQTFGVVLAQAGESSLKFIKPLLEGLSAVVGFLSRNKPIVVAFAAAVTSLGLFAAGKAAVSGLSAMWKWLDLAGIKTKAMGIYTSITAGETTVLDEKVSALSFTYGMLGDELTSVGEEMTATYAQLELLDAGYTDLQADLFATRIALSETTAEMGVEATASIGLGTALGGVAVAGAGVLGAFVALAAPIAAIIAGAAAIGIAIGELIVHFKAVEHAVSNAFHAVTGFFGGIGHALGIGGTASGSVPAKGTMTYAQEVTQLEKQGTPSYLATALANKMQAAGQFSAVAGTTSLNTAVNGGIGGVRGVAGLGAGTDQGPQINIHPHDVVLNLDGRQLARGVVRYTVERAARGPSGLIGGSLVTGAGGPSSPGD